MNAIPGAIQQAPAELAPAAPAAFAPTSSRLYLEDAFTAVSRRGALLVPAPATLASEDWQNRTSLDGTGKWAAGEHLDVTVSDRFNGIAENDIAIPAHHDFRNDFREGYATWEPAPETYLEAGRINVRHGVAVGFNPTDFLKARTLVSQASADPSVIRQDRLGTAMVETQRIFDGGAVALVVAPRLRSPSPIPNGPAPSLDPGLGRTNGQNQVLLSGSYQVADDLSPELLLYHADSGTRFGANISRTVGQSIVLYGEWAGGNQASLSSRAVAFGKATGTLPASVADPGSGRFFQNDAAVGGSWTNAASKLTVNLEYHYHQSGFSRADWRNWFSTGSSGVPGAAGVQWYLRGYAADQQEPNTRQQVFLRIDRSDAFIDDLEISAFAFVDAYDGSVLTQVDVSYNLSDAWTVGALAGGSLGGSRSERGSLPQQASAILQLVRYF